MQLNEPINLIVYADTHNDHALSEHIRSLGDLQKIAKKLHPVFHVSNFWPQQPSEYDLHILVTLPIGKSTQQKLLIVYAFFARNPAYET